MNGPFDCELTTNGASSYVFRYIGTENINMLELLSRNHYYRCTLERGQWSFR